MSRGAMNRGYKQITGPFKKGDVIALIEGEDLAENIAVKRVSVQLFNNWPFESFLLGQNETNEMPKNLKNNEVKSSGFYSMDSFELVLFDPAILPQDGSSILSYKIGKSGILELDDLQDLGVIGLKFNHNMPATTTIDIELT